MAMSKRPRNRYADGVPTDAKTIVAKDGDVRLFQMFTPDEAKELKGAIEREIKDRLHRGRLVVFGKECMTPRLHAAFGSVDYKFSGGTVAAEPWPPSLLYLKEKVENLVAEHYSKEIGDEAFNFVLCNWYRDGRDNIGYHSDDEAGIRLPLIVSVSLGATRDFLLKHKENKETTKVALKSGSVLVMAGDTQRNYKHSVPKRAGVTEPRLNLTFRVMRDTK